MTGTSAGISAVICTHTLDRWDDLCASVGSMRSQTLAPREVIVVIDHNEPLLARVRSEMPDVVALDNREARGLSGARNTGIAAARGSLIAFLDDDATAAPGWLEWLTRSCEDPRVLGAGGRAEPNWAYKPSEWFPAEFYWVLGCTYRGLPTATAEVRNLYGGCSCIKREVFESVGGFRSGIGRIGNRPLGGEETELCIRARQHWPHGTFLFEPQAVIYHKVPRDRVTWGYLRSRCFHEGLSKAHIARIVGSRDGLSSERRYTFRTLPRGVLRGVGDACLQRDPLGLVRAAAIVFGLAVTTLGFAVGKLTKPTEVEQLPAQEPAGVRRDLAV